MPTNIYQRGLQFFIEAEAHGGANGDVISSVTDLSVYGRNVTASSAQPTVKTGAVNGKRSFNFNGTRNPLKFTGDLKIRSGFMVVKVNGNFTGAYQGILSAVTGYGILTGIGGSGLLFDFLYDYYEYRLNDHIYPVTFDRSGNRSFTAPAPISSWGIIYFHFWQGLNIDGIQIGQDRGFTDRKFNGEIALLALYNRDFCEIEIRNNMQSIASSYQLALPDVFPFQGTKGDTVTTSKRVLSDGQDEPVTRIKRGVKNLFELNFVDRHQKERVMANAFWDEFHPNKRFYYRDYQNLPPVDTLVRIPENSEFQWKGGTSINNNSYSFPVLESIIPAATAIPGAPVIPDESEVVEPSDTEPPTEPGDIILLSFTATSVGGSFAAATDNVAVAGYEIRRADNFAMSVNVQIHDIGNTTSFNITGLTPDHEYWWEVRAYDEAGNRSAWTGKIEGWTNAETVEPENWALTSKGATAAAFFWDGAGADYAGETSNNFISSVYAPLAAINGCRHTNGQYGSNASTGSAWVSSAYGFQGHNILEINLAAPRTIEQVNVFALDSAASGTTDPSPSATSTYAIKAFRIRYYNGASWVTAATVTANSLTWKQVNITPVTAQKWRIDVSETGDNFQIRMCEAELIGV